jgi:thioredoxin reductase (NADPH)
MIKYDALIVGGGIAGLQAAIQLGRYRHNVLLVDKGDGRSVWCKSYRNVLGWPEGVSGQELRERGRRHAESLEVVFATDEVVKAEKTESGFRCFGFQGTYEGRTMLLSTGIVDRFPPIPGLTECLGLSVYICSDCDGYEATNKHTVIIGSGNTGASMATMVRHWTRDITYINHEGRPVSNEWMDRLRKMEIGYMDVAVTQLEHEAGHLQRIHIARGDALLAEKSFIAFGGNRIRTELADMLGAERLENKHINADPRTKMTSVSGLWSAGDINVHSEQMTIAMAEGNQAAIWMHKFLMAKELVGSHE